ncbi:hypothetical protein LPB87_05345 [Flavobacterium sp. EDS]|uniref:hypothetical protein n=1 Tax=Flavobacterium sp. EDS TaxID=2897328 RepID=UPI001E5FB653|nr:hypothetical protein [Flavobacterium sp. EDS]MCD0473814.1 hypothetical protein [Flavobacterium sp. EDS]
MIYVFKTSVNTASKLESATTILNELLPGVKWNFDLDDWDNILRIDSETNIVEMILNNDVFDCIELE